jgi:BirA family biotin operon repressor/biotin-[acetyl-CoA-carboxylase] ligase
VPFDDELYRRHRRATTVPAGAGAGVGAGVGATVRFREETASTMDDAREGADGGEPCGTAYAAGLQSAGRGRQGRQWISPPGAGLHVTFHLCPSRSQRAQLLSAAGALAAADAVLEASGRETELKWPNDVLVGGRKLVGVLAEARHGARLDVFVGIGINVRFAADMPEEVSAIATSIEREGVAPPNEIPSLEHLLAALAAALERWAALFDRDPDALIEEWRGRLGTIGRRVRLATPGGVVEGEAVDVTEHGELVLRLDDGSTEAYSAGDVTTA